MPVSVLDLYQYLIFHNDTYVHCMRHKDKYITGNGGFISNNQAPLELILYFYYCTPIIILLQSTIIANCGNGNCDLYLAMNNVLFFNYR